MRRGKSAAKWTARRGRSSAISKATIASREMRVAVEDLGRLYFLPPSLADGADDHIDAAT